jgi:hypothetical protein
MGDIKYFDLFQMIAIATLNFKLNFPIGTRDTYRFSLSFSNILLAVLKKLLILEH